ncbi:MAG: crosslink repair DNA glycosylase YcaQ family protein [Ignavibacteria bacterium]
MNLVIAKKDAIKIILKNQLLLNSDLNGSKDSILKIISQLGYIQIDTISVTERSVNHIIWSRTGNFDKDIINKLFLEKKIFEYWSHAAAILPMHDYRYSMIFKNYYIERYGSFKKNNNRLLKYVKDRIRSEGALMSRDFEDKRTGTSGWWNRKPAKEALEFLFFSGELMVRERIGFQKVYDLTERVLPFDIDDSIPTKEEYYKYLILSSIKANGIISGKEMTYLKRNDKNVFSDVLNELLEDKQICEITINGVNSINYYSKPELLNMNISDKSGLKILSPFDNLIIQRERIKHIFNFDYQLECYVPQTKRRYGYFSMPVLYDNKFIGRIDMKSDRKIKTLKVNNFYCENALNLSSTQIKKLNSVLLKYAGFTGCERVEWM